jgi:hypothetical protein
VALVPLDHHDLGLALRTRDMRLGERVEHMLNWTRELQEFARSAHTVR